MAVSTATTTKYLFPTVNASGESYVLDHGAVTIAAITSCTNTSNPSVMIGAGLLAKKAVEAGLERKRGAFGLDRLVVEMDDVVIGEGALISPFVTFTSNIRIGNHFHANLYSYVEHDCVIGDYVTLAPGVRCNGNVHIDIFMSEIRKDRKSYSFADVSL